MSSSGDLYEYSPLGHDDSCLSNRRTRLITLLPGTWGTPISCSIHEVDLDSNPVYEALSYVWGSVKHKRQITLGDKRWEVTKNLKEALQNLRFSDAPRVLWVDALCIDQSNLGERSQQVQYMHQIYHGASQVLIWVREKSSETKLAFQTILEICRALKFRVWSRCAESTGIPIEKLTVPHIVTFITSQEHALFEDFLDTNVSPHDLVTTLACFDIFDAARSNLQTTLQAKTPGGKHNLTIEELAVILSEHGIQYDQLNRSKTLFTLRQLIPILAENAANIVQEHSLERFLLQGGRNRYSLNGDDLVERIFALNEVFWLPDWWSRIWVLQELAYATSAVLVCGDSLMPFELCVLARAALQTGYKLFSSHRSTLRRLEEPLLYVASLSELKINSRGRSDQDLMTLTWEFSRMSSTDPRDKIFALLNLTVGTLNRLEPDYTLPFADVFVFATRHIILESRSLGVICGKSGTFAPMMSEGTGTLPSWVPNFESKVNWRLQTLPNQKTFYNASGSNSVPSDCVVAGNSSQLLLRGWTSDKVALVRKPFSPFGLAEDLKDIWAQIREWAPPIDHIYPTGCKSIEAYWRTMLIDRFMGRRLSEYKMELSIIRAKFWWASELPFDELVIDDGNRRKIFESSDFFDEEFLAEAYSSLDEKSFCQTENGYIGMIYDSYPSAGDIVFVARGCDWPLILRQTERESQLRGQNLPVYTLVGGAYIHGIMDGEIVAAAATGELEEVALILE